MIRLRRIPARRLVRAVLTGAAHTATVALLVSVPAAAAADPTGPMYLAVNDLPTVVANLRAWLIGILAGVATLFLVVAGVYYATAGGDPAQVEKGKGAFRSALVGYALAVLAPVLLQALQSILGS